MATREPENLQRVEVLRRRLAEDPRSLAFVSLAEELNRVRDFHEAAAVAQHGLLNHPDSVAGRLALAVAEAERNNIKEALEQIKRALIIDQENPQALALMGQILLKRGLAKRAVQFLSHAVKLAPSDPTYLELLQRARQEAALADTSQPAVFTADAVPNTNDPWADDAGTPGVEHTVFDPDAAVGRSAKGRVPGATGLRAHEGLSGTEEPTAHYRPLPNMAVQGAAEGAPMASGATPKAKVGGSAADYSQMMRRLQLPDDDVSSEVEPTVAATKAPISPSAAAGGPPSKVGAPPRDGSGGHPDSGSSGGSRVAVAPAPDAPSVLRARAAAGSGEGSQRGPPVLPPVTDDLQVSEATVGLDADRRRGPSDDDAARSLPSFPASPPRAAPPSGSGLKATLEPAGSPDAPAQSSAAGRALVPSGASAADPASVARGPRAVGESASVARGPRAVGESTANPADQPSDKRADKQADQQAEKRADKRVGPAATRMVDDALWALFGKRSASDSGRRPMNGERKDGDDEPSRAAKGPVRARLRVRDADPEPVPPRVVRTSERFGTWAQVATLAVLSVAGAVVGHWVMLSSAGPGPEVASEEVKGLASDLERGGLASLLAAEEKTNELARSAPDLEGLLNGVRVEIYGRRWRSFGRDPEMRARALEAADALKERPPTVEHLAGLVALATSAEDREPLVGALQAAAAEYPESPKVRVLLAQLYMAGGRERAALNALFEARARHKQHRLTMLELARWYRRSAAYAAALDAYAKLLDRYPLDIEGAIERYVLGQATGEDPDDAQAVLLLGGLVREENPLVAKDETGRASLALAIPLFARGQLIEGIEALGRAEAAFERSVPFKLAVANAYLAVGEFDRAEPLYEAATQLAPDYRPAQVGLARARFAKAAGLKADLARESERLAREFRARKGPGIGAARLPFGVLRLAPGRFELVTLQPDPSVFPEEGYRRAKKPEDLEAVSLTALANRWLALGELDRAVAKFEAALNEKPSTAARFGLGRALMAQGKAVEASRALRVALSEDPGDIPGRLSMARSLLARDQPIEALEVLEPLENSEIVVPDALVLLGRLRITRGDYEGALGPLKTVADLRPNDVVSRSAYGEALHRLGRTDDAASVFAELAGLPPGSEEDLSPIALMYLGRVELERDRQRGVALLRQALKHEEVPPEAHYYLGRTLVRRRRTRREGRRELQRYVRVGPPGELRSQARRLLGRR